MSTINVLGEAVRASAARPVESARQQWFRLLPYGETSAVMASGHQFTVDGPGRVVLPADPTAVLANTEHDRAKGIGHFDRLEDETDGLYGRYVAASGPAGDAALDDLATGRRRGVSVELEAPVIRAGKLLRGFLSHVGHVAKPSFASSTVLAAAADVGELTEDLADAAAAISHAQNLLASSTEDDQDPETETTTETGDHASGPATTTEKETTVTATATTAPASAALAAAQASGTPAPAVDHLTVLASAQAKLSAPGMHSSTVTAAALDQITQDDVFDKINAPQYAGELWKGRRYAGRYLDLLLSAPMTAQSVIGWRWVNGKTPQVARWSPPSSGTPRTMNDIPTNEVKAEQVTHSGFRMAGGNAVDRIHQDLPSAEWWASYNQESTDDYARKLDAEVIAHITTPANMTALTLEAGMPTERRILEGLGELASFADADWILLGWDLFVEMALAKKFDQSHAMSSDDNRILMSGGNFATSYLGVPVKAAPRQLTEQNGRIIIGCKAANELQSLPGGPIRVEAQTIQKGLIEHGVFGYHILRDIDKRGVLDVQPEAAPAG